MTIETFIEEAMPFTLEQLRCDVPPTQEILDLIDRTGPSYEAFVLTIEADRN